MNRPVKVDILGEGEKEMGMFDSAIVYQDCPKCGQWSSFEFQTKDLACVMDTYHPLNDDWFTSEDVLFGGKKMREKLPVFRKYPKDKEYSVWANQAEHTEAQATLEEPYASQLKFVNFYSSCPKCHSFLDGKIRVEQGMLIGKLYDVAITDG